MAKMTLEKAESVLEKVRNWYSHGISDLELVKKRERTLRDGGYTMLFSSLTLIKLGIYKDWELTMASWALFIGIFGFGLSMIFGSSRYSKIRQLFDDAAPQNLKDLRPSSPDRPLV